MSPDTTLTDAELIAAIGAVRAFLEDGETHSGCFTNSKGYP